MINNHKGDVIDMGTFHFYLMEIGEWVGSDQYTGRILSIPNGKIFTETKANYSQGFDSIWNEIQVRITFESNWEKAKEILNSIAIEYGDHNDKRVKSESKSTMRTYLISNIEFEPRIFTKIVENGIEFTIRYMCKTRNRRNSENLIYEKIIAEFSKNKDISFAYNTTRFFDNTKESKNKPDIKEE